MKIFMTWIFEELSEDDEETLGDYQKENLRL